MSALPLPAAAGPVVGLVGRSGWYMGYSVRETAGAAAAIRIWAGPGAGITPPTGSGNVNSSALLDEVQLASNGSADFTLENPMNGEQYVNGIYIELVTGAMPQGTVRVRGPHS